MENEQKKDFRSTFPKELFVSHYDHSRESLPSFNAGPAKLEVVEENGPTYVATYELKSITLIEKKLDEKDIPF
jgi:hypothetical protein